MDKIKILVNTVPLDIPSGVADHFLGLQNKFTQNVKYNYIGGRSKSKLFLFHQLKDYLQFIIQLIKFSPDIVLLNPSLDKKALIRDSLFLLITKVFKKKNVVFYHGWKIDVENLITKKYSKLFISIYNKANAHIVLCTDFQKKLVEWGINTPVFLETTKVDDDLLTDFDCYNKEYDNTILFLSRIEKEKGIYIAIDAVNKLPNTKMIIAGTGGELKNCKNYVKQKNITNVEFYGHISGIDKINAFKESSIYILPTWHGEGMPTSVLESMAFGLPIITRPVGGLKDFFENEKMGYLTDSMDSNVYVELIQQLVTDKEKMKKMGLYNHEYAKQKFLASKVAENLEKIFLNVQYPEK